MTPEVQGHALKPDEKDDGAVWKWIAALLAAVMLAGAPSIVQAVRAPSQEEVDIIRERQNTVLQRLAVIDEQISQNQLLLAQLVAELRDHEQQTTRR